MTMIVGILLTLLLSLSMLRRLVEPSCPCCAAKRWAASATALHCEQCGWTNATPARVEPKPQYEMVLG